MMQQTLWFFSQPLPPSPATLPSPTVNAPLFKPRQKATPTTCLIPLTDKQIVKQKAQPQWRRRGRFLDFTQQSPYRSHSLTQCFVYLLLLLLFFLFFHITEQHPPTSSDVPEPRIHWRRKEQTGCALLVCFQCILNTLNKTLVSTQYLYTGGHV